jgi:outer membrane protein assembly factor BamB
VHLLDAHTGRAVWTTAISEVGPLSAPAQMDSRLYVASAVGLHCLAADTGAELWRQVCDGPADERLRPLLAVADGRAYVVEKRMSGTGSLYAMDLASHQVAWSQPVPRVTHMLAAADALYLRGQSIQALAGATGKQRWALDAAGCSPLSYTDGMIYYVDSADSGRLVALEPRGGTSTWELAGLNSCSAFQKVGDRGFLKTADGVVHVLAFVQ